jgi:hypothetical protein
MSGQKYTTQCDIYSIAICTWEVFSRRTPYDDKAQIMNTQYLLYCGIVDHDLRCPSVSVDV